jgi:XTP/dITP diphosphohydrolase
MTLILATRNTHKVEEIRSILGSELTFLTLTDFPAAPTVVEDAGTFAGNATKKALELARFIGASPRVFEASETVFVLADDSGLEVDALKGAPGVHSARFAALDSAAPVNSADSDNRAKLLRLLEDVPEEKRTARFRCILALTPILRPTSQGASPVCFADELELQTELFEGTCEGKIGFMERGQGGFGYDSLFVPVGYDQTFGELSSTVKNRLSHRAQALAKLLTRLSTGRIKA